MKESILIINPYLKIGGVERALLSLLYALPRNQYNISLMLIYYSGEFLEYVPDDVTIVPCPLKSKFKGLVSPSSKNIIKECLKKRDIIAVVNYIFSYLVLKLFGKEYFYRKLLFEDQSLKFDYVFNFSGPNLWTSIISEEYVNCKKKFIWIHNEFQKANKDVKKYLARYSRYNGIFAVSKSCLHEFNEIAPKLKDKTFLLYNTIDSDMYYKLASTEQTSFPDDYNGLRLLSVGRLNYQKGFDLAPIISRKLKEKGLDFRWYIIGEGSERDRIEKMIYKYDVGDNVVLLGSKTNPYPYFRDCDIYVQPSRFEGYCLTIAEAKAFYKPIVSTNFAGAYDQIQNNENGLIVECRIDDLEKGIESLIIDNAKRVHFSNNLKKGSVNTLNEIYKLSNLLHSL